jgi:hypothetical protein
MNTDILLACTSALAGLIGVLIGIFWDARKNRKEVFIRSVTSERLKYLKNLRDLVAEFCYLAKHTDTKSIDRIDKIAVQIKLLMNPAGYDEWDGKAVDLIEKIIDRNNNNNQSENLKKFIDIMQSWFALEWEGIRIESEKGILSDEKKQELRNKHYGQKKS